MVQNAIAPYNHGEQARRQALIIAQEWGLAAWATNQILQAIQQGANLYEAARPYLPDSTTLATFRQRANDALERFTTPDQGYIDLLNEQARQGTLGQPAGFARLAQDTNEALQIRENANNQLMQPENRQNYIQQQIAISNEVYTGTLISQFTFYYTDG